MSEATVSGNGFEDLASIHQEARAFFWWKLRSAEADDLAQEAVLRIWLWSSGDPETTSEDRARIRRTVCGRVLVDHWRRAARQPALVEFDEHVHGPANDGDPSRGMQRREEAEIRLGALSECEREAVLVYLDTGYESVANERERNRLAQRVFTANRRLESLFDC